MKENKSLTSSKTSSVIFSKIVQPSPTIVTQKATKEPSMLKNGRKKRNDLLKLRRKYVKLSNKKIAFKKEFQSEEISRPSSAPPNIINEFLPAEDTVVPRKITFGSINSDLKQKYGSAARISFSPKKRSKSVDECIRLKTTSNLTENQYIAIAKEVGNLPSLSTVKRKENDIVNESGKVVATYNRIASLIINAVESCKYDLPEKVEIVKLGDKGGVDSKEAFYFVDVPNPLSPSNLRIISSRNCDENEENLRPIGEEFDAAIIQLKDGVTTTKGFKTFEYIKSGDNKYQSLYSGCQGGYAEKGCINCLSPRSTWNNIDKENMILRTIDSVINDISNINNEITKKVAKSKKKNISKNTISIIKRKFNSVSHMPLMKHIPLTNYCPGPVHTLISLVNAIIKLADKEEGKQLREYVEQLQLSIHYPAQEYEGNQCRYIVNHFTSKDCNYNGFGKEMLLGVADIQQFAVARRLLPNEIIMLKNAIQKMHQMLRPFPQIMTKNKMHILFHHLMPFVEKFKSWGLYSEQSIESIHHVKNICDSRIHGRSDRVLLKREKFFKKKQILKNYSFDN